MKIIRLEILNLASLDKKEGEVIDFEHGPLGESNLFSIVGETGSGKSTILDAICLALYGRAPRYPRKKGDRNQVIEIYGKTDDKEQYRPAPTDCRNILTRGQKTGYSKLTFRATNGFVYRAEWHVQFMRLKYADPVTALYRITTDENGLHTETMEKWDSLPIIIGLDYEQFLRTVLIAQGSFANFLTAKENERYELLEKLIGCEDTYKNIAHEISESKSIAVERYNEAMADVKAFAQNLLSDDDLAALNEKIKRLEDAEKEINDQIDIAKRQQQWYKDEENLLTEISANTDKYNSAREAMEQIKEAIGRLDLHDRLREAIDIVREHKRLSAAINDTSRDIVRINDERTDIESKIAAASEDKKLLEDSVDRARICIEQTAPHIRRAREIKTQISLAEEGLKEKKKDCDTASTESKKAKENLDKNAKDIVTFTSEKDKKAKALTSLNEKFDNQKKKFGEDETEIALKLNGAMAKTDGIDADTLIAEKERTAKELAELNEAIETLGKIETTTISLFDNKKRKELLEENNKVLGEKLQRLSIAKLEEEVGTLNKSHTLMTSERWSSHRASLEEGKPCPLCGGTHHPYSTAPSEFDEAASELSNLLEEKKTLLKQQKDNDKAWNASIQNNKGVITELNSTIQQLSETLNMANSKWDDLHSKHPDWPKDSVQLVTLVQETTQKNEKAANDLTAYNQTQKEVEKLRKQKDNAAEKKAKYEQKMLADIDAAKADMSDTEKRLSGCISLTANLREQLESKQDALANANEALAQAELKLITLKDEFNRALDGKDPDKEEKRLNDAKKEADDKLAVNIGNISALKEKAGLIDGRLKAKREQLSADEKCKSEKDEALSHWLSVYNADTTEPATRDTVMSIAAADDDWEAIRRDKEAKTSAIISAEALVKKSQENHSEHQTYKPALTKEELDDRVTALAAQRPTDELAEAMIRRSKHEDAVRNMGDKAEALKMAQQAKQDWEEISAAIGADGKTMRKIAQCYTLRFLIEHANSEIRKFNQRYELRQVTNSLGIRVIDHDRGDDIRDTTSLSGGETFIVSLGLALGLSSLSSKNISFSNLFIDEGFGTLDPNTLTTVIDSLAMLQTSQGKKVGVISHTDIMSERIPTQIRVIKHGSSGSSHIELQ